MILFVNNDEKNLCDVKDCKNLASYRIKYESGSVSLEDDEWALCDDCNFKKLVFKDYRISQVLIKK